MYLFTYNDLKDSCFVKLHDAKYVMLSPKSIVTDTATSIQFSVTAYDQDSVKHVIPVNEYSFSSSNSSIGNINSTGLFKGSKEGTSKIIIGYKELKDTAQVKVEIGSGARLLNDMENLSNWSVTGENLDSLSISLSNDEKSQGNSSLKVKYRYNLNSGVNMLYLNCDIPIYGVPDSIFIDVKSNGLNNRMYYRFADDNGEFFKAQAKKYLNNSQVFDRIPAPMKGLAPVDANSFFNYPLALKRIEIQLASIPTGSDFVSGEMYFDNLIIKYPLNATSINENFSRPESYNLYQNFPNPFNPATSIKFSIPKRGMVNLKVYNILGKEVAQLINNELNAGTHKVEFNAVNLSSGVYFYRIQFDGFAKVQKMILLK